MKKLLYIILITINAIGFHLHAADYYVSSSIGNDSNDGLSPTSPWATLDRVSTGALLPGDNVYFKAGDTFIGQLKPSYSGVEGAPISFGRFGEGNKPILNGAGGAKGDHHAVIYINNQEYLEFDNLEITNDRKRWINGFSNKEAYGIDVYNDGTEIMHHFIFTNLTIRDIFPVTFDSSDFNQIKSAGINFKTEKNTVAGQEKHIRDVTVDNCYITMTTKFGIWSRHGGGSDGVGNEMINRNMNFILTNNHTFKTGGSGITPGNTYNVLVENNLFEYPGADENGRMAGRGSGAWFFNTRHVVAQYNTSKHARGSGDSYGIHIDHSNKYVLLQYNYSEDSEGGFAEILGNNEYSTYRFNISVNDGFRDSKGNTLWVSQYPHDEPKSQHNYIYNNSVYIDKTLNGTSLTTGIDIDGVNTYVFNNAFYVATGASMGQKLLSINDGANLDVDNNLYFGAVANGFTGIDSSAIFNNPQYIDNGLLEPIAYKLESTSPAIGTARAVTEPPFPKAGQGIFSHISANATSDFFGNPVNLASSGGNIGAYNGIGIGPTVYEAEDATLIGSVKLNQCVNYSGSSAVKSINNSKKVAFENVYADLAGYYTLTISTQSKTDASVSYQVNSGIVQTLATTGSGLFCFEGGQPTDVKAVVYLEAGVNSIIISDSAPLDRITIDPDVSVDYESENAVLNGTANATSCVLASNGQIVKNIGNNANNSVLFDSINVPTAGQYKIDVYYYATSTRDMGVSVNGGAIQLYSINASGNWCYQGGSPGRAQISVQLDAGVNNIQLSHLTVLDKLTVNW
ncbi:CBM35 domain-containing protein [Thalassotalea sp. Y01]|uniref:CBM35 domain-containing protein n=1 Tax=Thalassotalea sp. Y01 TaxID=2729613 RepID=UPI00145C3FEF|nr:CBM35 domain-containing protein [Thalassotalea sp. Y01]NMP17145.1 hypothetical protein [Thalassotalea sp. Y01]